ncbi:MAG: c-type cytochrome [Thermoanaerobaculia bacterium]
MRSSSTLVLAALAALLLGGCRQDMHDQPKYQPLEASELFPNGAASRAPVEGTVARGMLRQDSRLFRGMAADGSFIDEIPLSVTAELVVRGRDRFDIFCSPCHGRTGDGQGMVVSRGFKQPESLHAERLVQSQDGYFYDVVSNGFGQMSSYAAQVKPEDRWAIVAYVKALQLSRRAPVELLTAEEVRRLASTEAPAAASEPEEQHP